ncbi:basic secretory protein-like protein [Proteiniphilum sp.]|uniref:basic secretory protein-like protein n=1 Tax=Proteiniphilum sp. TaxID=1926877 RepID=UPI002B1F4930|nr:basic secretory protein-like protein [Proteiniphilum sp.]MEA4918770.1 basic secretory protein-like protein [Proteiniphilum sp.]
MKIRNLLLVLAVLSVVSCSSIMFSQKKAGNWQNFRYPEINFVNHASGTKGWETYNRIIPDPEGYIKAAALEVVKTLYWSEKDSIPGVTKINYEIRDVDGISAKGGTPPEITIFYSSRWVEKCEKDGGDDKILFETRGVLLHELTHGFQLEPQGIGTYADGGEFWIFIEGMADAVRIHNGGFPEGNRRPGGSWRDGYQRTGYFLDWLTTKDPDFLRKFNKSALDIVPWGFDKAIKHVLGKQYSVDGLWDEYQQYIQSTSVKN